MRAKTGESPSIKSKMDDVAEAVAAVKRDLIAELPKMRRSGWTDIGDLQVAFRTDALLPRTRTIRMTSTATSSAT
jgi:hypothetical protein